MKGRCFVILLLTVFHASVQARSDDQLHVVRPKLAAAHGQEFVCVSPYTVAECERQFAILRGVLDRYHAEILGKWTWVLVRSEDWKQLIARLHLSPNSPAFSHLAMRQTFLEEVLLMPRPQRQIELVNLWHIPFDQFLDFAVTHELGHAFCKEPDEIAAEKAGQRLREGKASVCDIRRRKSSHVARSGFPNNAPH